MHRRLKCIICYSFHHITTIDDTSVFDGWHVVELTVVVVQYLQAARIILEKKRESAIVGVSSASDAEIKLFLLYLRVIQSSKVVMSFANKVI